MSVHLRGRSFPGRQPAALRGVTLCLLADMVSCALVVVIFVITPRRHVWRTYVRTAV